MTLLADLLILGWAHLTHKPWRELGFVRPRNWFVTIVGGIAFGVVFKLVMKAIVMPLLGAPELNAAYHSLAGNTSALPAVIFTMIVQAGFGEELLYRGFLFDRLAKWFGRSIPARIATVLVTTALFAALHYPDQRLPGVEQAVVSGLVLGTIYAWTQRIWFVMIAHAAFDLAAVYLIYARLESTVAHLLFR